MTGPRPAQAENCHRVRPVGDKNRHLETASEGHKAPPAVARGPRWLILAEFWDIPPLVPYRWPSGTASAKG